MNFNEYQQACKRTAGKFDTVHQAQCNWAMGLCGEAGEYTELVKKEVFHQVVADRDKLKKELGDVLWYLSQCATVNDILLEDIAIANIEKLKARYPEKFVPGGGNR